MLARLLAVGVIVAAAGSAVCPEARGDFIPGTFLCEFPDDPCTLHHTWTFTDSNDVLRLQEALDHFGPDQVVMSGDTDADPTFTVIKTVENDTLIDWTGYTVSLDGTDGASFVQGSAGSTRFSGVSVEPLRVTFSSPQVIKPSELVTIQFNINLPNTGGFRFTLTQEAVPEPTMLALLGLGGAALLVRRRRRRT